MSDRTSFPNRRDILKSTTGIVAASALAGVAIPTVHAGENNTIDVALIGCGGRGTGAAVNALSTKSGPIRLTAMADAFKDRLTGSYDNLKKRITEEERLQVKDDMKFVGFDAYKNAMDALKPGEVSQPVQSPFGWHLIVVDERRVQDVSDDRKRAAARNALRERKSDEAFQDWLRQLRDRAYVEYRLEDR